MKNKQSFVPAVAALVCNAFIWGLTWWPLKELQLLGWHPLWSTTAIFALATTAFVLFNPKAISRLRESPVLWLIAFAAGVTNGAFNWGVAIGDVVRVILLFYLMPVWAVLLARLLLKEPISGFAVLRIVLALAGAALVLRPDGGGLPLPSNLADWLGLLGGVAFALNNVLIRRAAHLPQEGRALAMFIGGLLIPALVASAMSAAGSIAMPSAFVGNAALLLAGLGLAILIANLALQFGAAQLPANITAVVMLVEVVFAAGSTVLVNGTAPTIPMIAGGVLILTASALSALEGRRRTDQKRNA
ncbi:MAG: DMT family transporter [Pseudomonadota bacterium]